jgi:dinuclear metal center YbgI/SA1388 family protein
VSVTLADCVDVVDAAYDPATAEPWDAVGLVCGDPADPVERVHVAVDPTYAVAGEAVASGAQLLLVHHPLFLRGVHGVAATTPAGRVVTALQRAGCALLTAHTNADSALPGVSDALLEALGLDPTGAAPVRPLDAGLDALAVYVPTPQRETLLDALAAAGAGRLGAYARCGWWASGTGTFTPLAGAIPAIGRVGERAEVPEDRLEVVVPRRRRHAVVEALRAAHPYEEPAFWLWPLETGLRAGLGRLVDLAAPTTLRAFTASASAALPRTVWGLRASGDPDQPLRRVAVCGGAGGELAADAARAGADVLLTSDLRHHVTLDSPLPLVDAAHWATERPWCDQAAGLLRDAFGDRVTVTVSDIRTDPWTHV